MTREGNVEVVRRSFEAFEAMDVERWTADWDPDVEFDVTHYAPFTGEPKLYRGPTDILAFFGGMMAGIRVLKVDVATVEAVDDDRVMALYTETRQEPGADAPHDLAVGIVYTLRDGRFTHVVVHSDHDAARRTAGVD